MGQTFFQNGHFYTFCARFPVDGQGRPMVPVFMSPGHGTWQPFIMLADTGADDTLMPEGDAGGLGICDVTSGVFAELGTACDGKVGAYFHCLLAFVPGIDVRFPVVVGFSRGTSSRLLGRADMVTEFAVAFDSKAAYFLRD